MVFHCPKHQRRHMKKLLTFMMLLCVAALASNEPVALHVYGPGSVAKNSYAVPYFMATSGFLNGRPLGWTWECKDLNGNILDYIETNPYEREIKVDVRQTSFILYARFRYESYEDHTERYSYASYQVNVGEPTFTITNIGSIHNGDFDTTITGVTTRVIHFNIDSDNYVNGSLYSQTNTGEIIPDYLVEQKTVNDDDLLTIRIEHTPSSMEVRYIHLKLDLPNHLVLYRRGSNQEGKYVALGTAGQLQTISCGSSANFDRIIDKDLFVEGVGLGIGDLRINYYGYGGNLISHVADIRYRTSADIAGRQEMYSDGGYPFQYARSLSLTGCEFSIYDNNNISNTSLPSSLNNNNYNAPALAVDRYWLVKGEPFTVDVSGYGTPDDPFEYINGKWYTSYEAFGGSVAFYESTIWYPRLYSGVLLNDAEVINYEGLATALRSFYEPGICPDWKMFYMKLTGLSGWGSNAILHHRGEVLYQYYYDLHSSNNQSNWLPKKYGLDLP